MPQLHSLLSGRSLLLAAAAVATLTSSIASADDVIVRDHREASATPSVAPAQVRYRRAPGPRIMLPLKIDIGATGAGTDHGTASGIAGSIGLHWASLAPEPPSFDVGIGFTGAFMFAPDDMTVADDSNTAWYAGGYLELGKVLAHGTYWRTWASGRGEYLTSAAFDSPTHKGLGVSGRLSAELFAGGSGIDPRGIFVGAYAIGAYVEVAGRDMADGVGAFQATAGLTFRTPFVFGF